MEKKPMAEDYFRIIANALIEEGVVSKEKMLYHIYDCVEIPTLKLELFLKDSIGIVPKYKEKREGDVFISGREIRIEGEVFTIKDLNIESTGSVVHDIVNKLDTTIFSLAEFKYGNLLIAHRMLFSGEYQETI